MSKIGDCEYAIIDDCETDNYDIVEQKDLVENSEIFVIINSKENEEPSVLFMKDEKKNLEKDIPTNITHPLRGESRIPMPCENVAWISVPKKMLTTEFQNLCSNYNYPKTKTHKDGYVNIPEEWIFYKGNPAFVTDELLQIFSQKKA